MKTIKVSIIKYQVKVTKDQESLLVTNNNINAYSKLWNALQRQEADRYILNHWGKDIAKAYTKEEFISILSKWFEN